MCLVTFRSIVLYRAVGKQPQRCSRYSAMKRRRYLRAEGCLQAITTDKRVKSFAKFRYIASRDTIDRCHRWIYPNDRLMITYSTLLVQLTKLKSAQVLTSFENRELRMVAKAVDLIREATWKFFVCAIDK